MNKSIKILLFSIPVFLLIEVLFGVLAGIGLMGRSVDISVEVGMAVIMTWIFVTLRENKKTKVQ